MTTISREYSFCAAHQLEGHPKCGRIHGHNYLVKVTVKGIVSEDTGMIMDFAGLDQIVSPIIDQLDHRYLVSKANLRTGNPIAQVAIVQDMATLLPIEHSTAELLAQYLAEYLISEIVCTEVQVTVYETPKNAATHVVTKISFP